jgi:arabinofuranan 3-O-arabinosyltransferase
MLFPGYFASVDLGQNSVLTLAILLWGWLWLDRGRPGRAGAIWGLLAFKPVWAVAFFLVPLLTRRWRLALGMVGTGACLVALTLPLVGLQCWFDWLAVGKEASELYNTEENWVHLSRDLLGIPRRWLLRFDRPHAERQPPWPLPETSVVGRWWRQWFGTGEVPGWVIPSAAGWGLWLLVLGGTAVVARRRRGQAQALTGPAAAFVLLGAWLCCFHFMYYDVLVAAFPVCLLFAGPAPRARALWVYHRLIPGLVVLLVLLSQLLRLRPSAAAAGLAIPWDTFCLLALWLWCGWLSWNAELSSALRSTVRVPS